MIKYLVTNGSIFGNYSICLTLFEGTQKDLVMIKSLVTNESIFGK